MHNQKTSSRDGQLDPTTFHLLYGDHHSVFTIINSSGDKFTRLPVPIYLRFAYNDRDYLKEIIEIPRSRGRYSHSIFAKRILLSIDISLQKVDVLLQSDSIPGIVTVSVFYAGKSFESLLLFPLATRISLANYLTLTPTIDYLSQEGLSLKRFVVRDLMTGRSLAYRNAFMYASPKGMTLHIQGAKLSYSGSLNASVKETPQYSAPDDLKHSILLQQMPQEYFVNLIVACPLIWLKQDSILHPSAYTVLEGHSPIFPYKRVPEAYVSRFLTSPSIYDHPILAIKHHMVGSEAFHYIEIVFFRYTNHAYVWELYPAVDSSDMLPLIVEYIETAIASTAFQFRKITNTNDFAALSAFYRAPPTLFREPVVIRRNDALVTFARHIDRLASRPFFSSTDQDDELYSPCMIPRITFAGEEGVDVGGLLREFITAVPTDAVDKLHMLSLVNRQRGYYTVTPETGMDSIVACFRLPVRERIAVFRSLGAAMALSILANVKTNLSLSPALMFLLVKCAMFRVSSRPRIDMFYGSTYGGSGFFSTVRDTIRRIMVGLLQVDEKSFKRFIAYDDVVGNAASAPLPGSLPGAGGGGGERPPAGKRPYAQLIEEFSDSASLDNEQPPDATDTVGSTPCNSVSKADAVSLRQQRAAKTTAVGNTAIVLHPFDALALYFVETDLTSEDAMDLSHLLFPDLSRLGLSGCLDNRFEMSFLRTKTFMGGFTAFAKRFYSSKPKIMRPINITVAGVCDAPPEAGEKSANDFVVPLLLDHLLTATVRLHHSRASAKRGGSGDANARGSCSSEYGPGEAPLGQDGAASARGGGRAGGYALLSSLAPAYACSFAYAKMLGFVYFEVAAMADGFTKYLSQLEMVGGTIGSFTPCTYFLDRFYNTGAVITSKDVVAVAKFVGKRPCILAFLKAFDLLKQKERNMLIQFGTGLSYLTPEHELTIKLILDEGFLPQSHTCAFILELPALDDVDKMLAALRKCIDHMYFGFL